MTTDKDELDALRTRMPPDDLDSMSTRAAVPAPETRSSTALPGALEIGHVLDAKFLIVRRLGEGSAGIVYEAIELSTQARYGIKILKPELVENTTAIQSLRTEIATAQAVTHQNLLKVNYLAEHDGRAYVVMEYLDGSDLRVHLQQRGGRLPRAEALGIMGQVAAGLDYLHDRGFVHLDVKPQNIFVTRSGEIRVLDFGIAQALRPNSQLGGLHGGTLAYMAPEQLRAGKVDRRTDVYAFTLVLAELIGGALPFDVRDARGVLAWHLDPMHALGPTLPLDSETRRTCELALSSDPTARPTRCAEVLAGCQPPTASTASKPARPPLPNLVNDEAWSKHRNSILNRFDDPDKLRGPIPVHPDNLITDAQYTLSKWSEFSNGFLSKAKIQDSSRRFQMCVAALERWAFFYPQYRHPFVVLWNQGRSATGSDEISETYFSDETIRVRHSIDSVPDRDGAVDEARQSVRHGTTAPIASASQTGVVINSPKGLGSRFLKLCIWTSLVLTVIALLMFVVAKVVECSGREHWSLGVNDSGPGAPTQQTQPPAASAAVGGESAGIKKFSVSSPAELTAFGRSMLTEAAQRSADTDLTRAFAAAAGGLNVETGTTGRLQEADRAHYGIGDSPYDEPRATQLYEKLCDEGELTACAEFGIDLYFGTGWVLKQDRVRGKRLFESALDALKTACAAEDGRACSKLGFWYRTGMATDTSDIQYSGLDDQRPKTARPFVLRGCALKFAGACVQLVFLLGSLDTYEGDEWVRQLGIRWGLLDAACSAGQRVGCELLGEQVFAVGEQLFPASEKSTKIEQMVLHFFQRACDGNDGDGCADLGLLSFFDGHGIGGSPFPGARAALHITTRELRDASPLFVRACDLGSANGCRVLASMYEDGVGVSSDLTAATKYYGLACEYGLEDACKRKAK